MHRASETWALIFWYEKYLFDLLVFNNKVLSILNEFAMSQDFYFYL